MQVRVMAPYPNDKRLVQRYVAHRVDPYQHALITSHVYSREIPIRVMTWSDTLCFWFLIDGWSRAAGINNVQAPNLEI